MPSLKVFKDPEELIFKTDKQIRDANRHQIRDAVKIKCECGGSYTHSNKQKHLRTKKHTGQPRKKHVVRSLAEIYGRNYN